MNVNRILQNLGVFFNKKESAKDEMSRILTAGIIKLLDDSSRNVSALKHNLIKLQKNLPSSLQINDYLQQWELDEALTSINMSLDELIEEAKKPLLSKEEKEALDKEWFDCHG